MVEPADSLARRRFDALMLPHLAAAFNLAQWLTRNPDAAADVVQDSYVRALRFFEDYRGDNERAWLLAIVRNTSLNWLAKTRTNRTTSLSDQAAGGEGAAFFGEVADENADIEMELRQKQAAETLDQLIAALPVAFREVIILREIEDLSYKEISAVTGLPMGTVMSRIARARQALQKHWKKLSVNRGTS